MRESDASRLSSVSNVIKTSFFATRFIRRSLALFSSIASGDNAKSFSLMNEKLVNFHYAVQSSEQLQNFNKASETSTSSLLEIHMSHIKVGWTLTHIAAAAGQPKVIRALLDRGAPLDKVDMNGDTPLHIAYIFGSMRCVRIIEQAGADVEAKGICDDDDGFKNEFYPAQFLSIDSVFKAAQAGREKDVSLLVYFSAQVRLGGRFEGLGLRLPRPRLTSFLTGRRRLQGVYKLHFG